MSPRRQRSLPTATINGIRDKFQPGDRVEHFDYGLGTFSEIGPAFVYIAWDRAESMRASSGGCHDWHLIYHLLRIDPAAAVQPVEDLGDTQEHTIEVGRAMRGQVWLWLRQNGIDVKATVNRAVCRFTFHATDEQWEQIEKWLADRPRSELPTSERLRLP